MDRKSAKVIHWHPYAYCVAKIAPCCAVFIMPPQINPCTKDLYCFNGDDIHNESTKDCEVGKWYTIAYISDKNGNGWTEVIDEVAPQHFPIPKGYKQKAPKSYGAK